jgi:hypothetical protein
MTPPALTNHAITRLAQRGMSLSNVELITVIGSEVRDGYFVRTKDCQAVERELKQLIRRIRRLKGKRIVVADGRVITAFHAKPREERRLLRNAAEKNLEVLA